MRANRMSISRTHRTLHWTEEKASRCRLSMGTTVFLCAGMFTMYFLDAVLEGASEIYLLRSTTCTVIAQPEAPAVCAVTSTDGERRTVPGLIGTSLYTVATTHGMELGPTSAGSEERPGMF